MIAKHEGLLKSKIMVLIIKWRTHLVVIIHLWVELLSRVMLVKLRRWIFLVINDLICKLVFSRSHKALICLLLIVVPPIYILSISIMMKNIVILLILLILYLLIKLVNFWLSFKWWDFILVKFASEMFILFWNNAFIEVIYVIIYLCNMFVHVLLLQLIFFVSLYFIPDIVFLILFLFINFIEVLIVISTIIRAIIRPKMRWTIERRDKWWR